MSVRIADRIACFAGSMRFFWLNMGCFLAWIAVNTLTPIRFDTYPFQVLTLCLSVEAIFLTIFVLISQNRQAEEDRKMAQRDFQTNQYAEKEIRVLIARMQEQDEQLETIIERLERIV